MTLFVKNGYPCDFISKGANRFLSHKYGDSVPRKKTTPHNLLCIPYLGQPSLKFRSRLQSILQPFHLDAKVVFSTCKMRNFFSLKCKTPLSLVAGVVYKFVCRADPDVTYIGKTTRHLGTRVKEHTQNQNSAVHQHIALCKDCQDLGITINNFRILSHERFEFRLLVKEALFIKSQRPCLNCQLAGSGAWYTTAIF